MSDFKNLKINCIGLGHWGPNLVRAISMSPGAHVGTVCDLDESRLDLVRHNISSIEFYSTDPVATINDPTADAVIIATPTSTHYSLVKQALFAGKHVLVEKPLALDVNEADELVDLAEKQGLILAVGHVFLFNKGVLEIRNLIQSGELGPIHYIFSTRTNLGPFRTDCNALWDLASHDLSILNFWLDAKPLAVTARGQSFINPDIEDVVIANYTYPNNILASVHASWLNPSKVREITVVGQNRMAIFDDMNFETPVRVFAKSDSNQQSEYIDSFGAFRSSVNQSAVITPVVIPHAVGSEPVANQINHFIDCIKTGTIPINNARMAAEVVRNLTAAQVSMKNLSVLSPIQ